MDLFPQHLPEYGREFHQYESSSNTSRGKVRAPKLKKQEVCRIPGDIPERRVIEWEKRQARRRVPSPGPSSVPFSRVCVLATVADEDGVPVSIEPTNPMT
ncbi:hypothetical protein WA026_003186 [Henosepilachna vigintioctopunctata]|uniref:Uncharacterized protein n=1 Tax=Henosepilachna vigintioctopunctata TaxID=420089 RepID=A0AAW1TNW1_9CUCU